VVNRRDWIAVLLLAVLVLSVFWRATLGGVFYFGDIYQLHYPLRNAYAQALRNLSLPLWTPYVLAGYPLLAEGQVGALYPPNVILHALLPVPIALNLFVLSHFVWAAIGAYAFARRLRLRRTAAVCSGLVYALGGFLVGHLNHVNIVACASWMPWLFLLTDHLMVDDASRQRVRHATLLALAIGLELLAGHPQIAVLTLVAVVAYAAYLAWVLRPRTDAVLLGALSLCLGLALAAAQLLPTLELTQLSLRSAGLDPAFFASFSMHPLYLISLLWPFVLGNPYPNASIELVGYVGWLPLLVAILAPFVVRGRIHPSARSVRRTGFFAVLAVAAIVLSLGRWNPAYMILLRLPVLNWFRVPARYLYWFSFSVAMLSGVGLDALLNHKSSPLEEVEDARGWLVVGGVALLALLVISRVSSADELVSAWVWLPILLALLALSWLVWAWWGKNLLQAVRAPLALALVAADLIAFNAVFSLTYNQTMPAQQFSASPRSLSFFEAQEGFYRVYTHEEIVPVLPVMRESLYPNLSLLSGISSANGSFPLTVSRYGEYLQQMTPRMLDLLGVRYFIIPQVLPVDESSEFYDLEDPFALNPVGKVVSIPPVRTAELVVESYISHSVEWPDGHLVARILLHGTQGEREELELRAGWHTSEWAYDRSDVHLVVRHQQAPVARSWPARSGFPPEDHLGFTYTASFRLLTPFAVQAVEVQPMVPQAYLRIERLVLVDQAGKQLLLSHLANAGDHTLVYRSEDAAVYSNQDALPRALVVHKAEAIPDDAEALGRLRSPDFDPSTTVILTLDEIMPDDVTLSGTDKVDLLVYEPQKVVVKAQTASSGYLLLTDAWYPGWQAKMDGQKVPLLRADLIFRAVSIPAGEHVVEFAYRPRPFQIGLLISSCALVLLGGVWVWDRRERAKGAR
jgi:hypothetical protein